MRAHPAGKLGEGATAVSGAELCERQFQSTPPARGGDCRASTQAPVPTIFQSTPPRGGATGEVELVAGVVLKFQSTPPRRGATRCSSDLRWVPQNFNPRPREGGRRCGIAGAVQGIAISIHAPARGGDLEFFRIGCAPGDFNPRPREGGRPSRCIQSGASLPFQSTPPRGGATAKMHSFTCGSLTNK